jgi:hypothetical protein
MRLSQLAVLTDCVKVADRIGRVGAAKPACIEGKTVFCRVSSSAPFNLQPSEHGRLVASSGKRWLVGGKDVRRTMIPAAGAVRPTDHKQTRPSRSGSHH